MHIKNYFQLTSKYSPRYQLCTVLGISFVQSGLYLIPKYSPTPQISLAGVSMAQKSAYGGFG